MEDDDMMMDFDDDIEFEMEEDTQMSNFIDTNSAAEGESHARMTDCHSTVQF